MGFWGDLVIFEVKPIESPAGMHHSTCKYMLVNGFLDNFNKYWALNYVPSDLICVEESMSKWYRIGGHWINMGLPMYAAIDRKTVNACEIQNSCDAIYQVMMQLKLVKLEDD